MSHKDLAPKSAVTALQNLEKIIADAQKELSDANSRTKDVISDWTLEVEKETDDQKKMGFMADLKTYQARHGNLERQVTETYGWLKNHLDLANKQKTVFASISDVKARGCTKSGSEKAETIVKLLDKVLEIAASEKFEVDQELSLDKKHFLLDFMAFKASVYSRCIKELLDANESCVFAWQTEIGQMPDANEREAESDFFKESLEGDKGVNAQKAAAQKTLQQLDSLIAQLYEQLDLVDEEIENAKKTTRTSVSFTFSPKKTSGGD